LTEGYCRGIVSVEDGVTDTTLSVHVAVVNRGDEAYLGSLEGIITRELHVEQEESIFIWGFLGPEQ
jgi:hypothetical protein